MKLLKKNCSAYRIISKLYLLEDQWFFVGKLFHQFSLFTQSCATLLCLILTKCKRNLCTVPLLPYRRSPDFGQVLQLKLPEKLERENKEGGVIGNGRNHGKSHAFHIYGNVALYVWTLVMVKVMMVIPNFTVSVWTNMVWGGTVVAPLPALINIAAP